MRRCAVWRRPGAIRPPTPAWVGGALQNPARGAVRLGLPLSTARAKVRYPNRWGRALRTPTPWHQEPKLRARQPSYQPHSAASSPETDLGASNEQRTDDE
jgi:hypothetical protein